MAYNVSCKKGVETHNTSLIIHNTYHMTQYNFEGYKEDAITKPRDQAWDNWAKFEKVGDLVQGFIKDVFYRESEGDFKEQRGITLEQPDGVLINVGIKRIDFVLAKTDHLRLGDPLTVTLEKEVPPSVKGYSPTKVFGFYGKNLPENLSNKTVKELELIDKNMPEEIEETVADTVEQSPVEAVEEVETAPEAVEVDPAA